jgi:serine/threonine protein kinase
MINTINYISENIDSNNFLENKKEEGFIKIYDFNGNVKKVKTYTSLSQPFSKFKPINLLFTWIQQHFSFSKKVQLTVKQDSGELKNLYIKAHALKHILSNPVKTIENITQELIEHNTLQVIRKIENIVRQNNILPEQSTRKKLEKVATKVSYCNLAHIFEQKNIDSGKLFYTLMAISKKLARDSSSSIKQDSTDSIYGFEINEQAIYILLDKESNPFLLQSFMAPPKRQSSVNTETDSDDESMSLQDTVILHSNSNFENLQNSTVINKRDSSIKGEADDTKTSLKKYKQEPISVPVIDSQSNISKIKEARPIQVVFNDRWDGQSFWTKKSWKSPGNWASEKKLLEEQAEHSSYINRLKEEINEDKLFQLIREMDSKDDKKRMVNTFIRIGKELMNLSTENRKNSPYFKKQLAHTFPFGINENGIFISTQEIENGTYKEVDDAFYLQNSTLERFVRLKIKKDGCATGVSDIQKESEILQALHKKDDYNKKYIATPYQFQKTEENQPSQPNKFIAYQLQYDGNGENLLQASTHHLLNFFKGSAFGLAFLHQEGWVHRDFKLKNAFFQGDLLSSIPIEAKVADFGAIIEKDTYSMESIGTIPYLPPEAVITKEGLAIKNNVLAKENIKVNPVFDSFSLGVSLLEALSGSLSPLRLPKKEAINNYRIGEDTCVVYPCGLSQVEMDQVWNQVEKYIQSSTPFFQQKERKIKLAMVEIGRQLLQIDSAKRLSCLEAAHKFQEIQQEFYPNQRTNLTS